MCRRWNIYGHIWQPHCTNCFLALFVVLSLYLSVEDRHFRDTGLLQLEVRLFDKRVKHSYGCWLLQISCSAVSYSCSSVENVLFGSTAFSSACFFFMHFMLENGSSHSLLAWNAFRFSVKLFVFCKSFLKFWCSIISVAIVVTNLSFSL